MYFVLEIKDAREPQSVVLIFMIYFNDLSRILFLERQTYIILKRQTLSYLF